MQRLFLEAPRVVRGLLKSPGFSVPAVLILAVAIGAATAVFSVVDAVVLRPLPLPDSRELVVLCERHASLEGYCVMSPPNALDIGAGAGSLEAVGLARDWSFVVGGEGETRGVRGGIATPSFFDVLGITLLLGRGFAEDEVGPGRDRVVVLGHALWTTRFGADAAIVGRTIVVDGEPNTVVGVLPEGLAVPGLELVELWRPLHIDPLDPESRSWRGFQALARVADGAQLETVRGEVASLYAGLASEHEDVGPEWAVEVLGLRDHIVGDVRPTLLLFLGASLLLLVIGCANVANLLLVRAQRRRRETAVRAALGARGRDLAGDVVLESLVLAGAAGGLGLLLAVWATGFFVAMAPPGIPRLDEVGVDPRAVLFGVLLSLATVLAVGLLPSRRGAAGSLSDDLRVGGPTGDVGVRRTRQALVVAELALSLVLLAAASLVVRTFERWMGWEPGFEREGLLVVPVLFPVADYPSTAELRIAFGRAEEELRRVPGVAGVGMVSGGPVFGGIERTAYLPEGRLPDDGPAPLARYYDAGPGYLETLGVELVAGRTLAAGDGPESPAVAVVNETLARAAWGEGEVVGRRILLPERGTSLEIVGVVADVPPLTPGEAPEAEIYWSNRQETRWFPYFLVRGRAGGGEGPAGLAAAVRDRLLALDPDLDVGTIRPLEELVEQRLVRPRFTLWLVGAFALSALLLAVVGTYALVAFTVAQRTREMGIRFALGSSRGRIVAEVLREGLTLAALGAALGLGGALAAAGALAGVVQGIAPDDPLTLAATTLVFLAVTTAACLAPALRAARVDPRTLLE